MKRIATLVILSVVTLVALTGCPAPAPSEMMVSATILNGSGGTIFNGPVENFQQVKVPVNSGALSGSVYYDGVAMKSLTLTFFVGSQNAVVTIPASTAKTFESLDLLWLVAGGYIFATSDLLFQCGEDSEGAFSTFDFSVTAGVDKLLIYATSAEGLAFTNSFVREAGTTPPPPPPPTTKYYSLTKTIVGQGGINTSAPDGSIVNGKYKTGTVVTVVAAPATGWHFSHWTVNGVQGTNNPGTVKMDSDVALVGYFEQDATTNQYTLTTSVVGQGKVSGAGSYPAGTIVDVTATPETGWKFVKWSVNGTEGTNNPGTVEMNGDVALIGYFDQDCVDPPPPPPPGLAPVVDFELDGTKAGMRISVGNLTLRQITADASATFLPAGATYADVNSIGIQIVKMPDPYFYLRESSLGSMANNIWSTTIPLDGVGTDSAGISKTVAIANWVGGRVIPFYTLSSVPGRIFSLNTGTNAGTKDGKPLKTDSDGYIWQ